ncbi:MAG: transcriptional repressor LexA [Armatimonadota bacterium]
MLPEHEDGQPVVQKRGRKPSTEITEHQRRTLQAVRKHIEDRGVTPTTSELSRTLGITRSAIQDQIDQLIKKGYLSKDDGKARSISILKDHKNMPNPLISLPLVGTVPAGQPFFAEENIITRIYVDPSHLRGGEHFALQVEGNSMTGAGISDGDMLIVRRQALAETGDIIVALIGDDATVKRLWIREGKIELRPENPEFSPIEVHPDDAFRVIGKVVSVSHQTTSQQ